MCWGDRDCLSWEEFVPRGGVLLLSSGGSGAAEENVESWVFFQVCMLRKQEPGSLGSIVRVSDR